MFKLLILSALTINNALVAIGMRYSRIRSGDKFSPTTVVVCIEVVKLVASLAISIHQSPLPLQKIGETLTSISQPKMLIQMAIPSFVYLVQNNLLYVAATYLDSSIYQATFQSRILATALFSRLILSKRLTLVQWLSLLLLMIGIVTVNLSVLETPNANSNSLEEKTNNLLGIGAAFLAALCSGFAGVFLESQFKDNSCSLWVRNYQIALVSVPLGLILCWLNDDRPSGFFYGYDLFVICLILIQSVGGFLVAVVIKYADNILKDFATSLTLCILSLASHFLFNVHLNWLFGFGTFIVIASIWIYSIPTGNSIQKSNSNSKSKITTDGNRIDVEVGEDFGKELCLDRKLIAIPVPTFSI